LGIPLPALLTQDIGFSAIRALRGACYVARRQGVGIRSRSFFNTNMSGSREIKVFCLILGNNSPFPVKIAESDTIGDLKDKIKEKKSETLKGVEADKLVLWMVRVSLTDECHSLKPCLTR
jgi:hypothetical protein